MTHWTVVSRPGPVEGRILGELSPLFRVRRHIGAGVTLRLLDGGPERGPEDGSASPPIVFLHGRGHAATSWWPLLAPLAAHRRVVAFDLPGFGHSAARPWAGGGPRQGLSFFVDPVAAALSSLDLENAVLVGHSLGGLVALTIAIERRAAAGTPQPAALVLIDAMGLTPHLPAAARLYYRAGPERLARLRAPFRRALPADGPADGPSASHQDRADALRRELLEVRGGRPDATAAFDAMCPLVGDALHLEDQLASVEQPTLLVWGARDEVFPVAVARRAARLFPRAELCEVDAGHSPHVDRPAAVAAALDDFLGRLAP